MADKKSGGGRGRGDGVRKAGVSGQHKIQEEMQDPETERTERREGNVEIK